MKKYQFGKPGFLPIIGLLFVSATALADIKYVRAGADGKVTEVPSGDVEKTCKKNFAFREVKKDEVHAYLHMDIVKAAFTGQMQPSLDLVIKTIKASPGRCAWVTAEEFGTL